MSLIIPIRIYCFIFAHPECPYIKKYMVFGQNIHYIRKELLILPEKCWESLYADCEVLVILIRKRALVKYAHRATTS